jgi:hypothetical protein
MNTSFNTLTVQDLKRMFAAINTLDTEDPVPELIEISEGFEAAISQCFVDQPEDHHRLVMLLGLVWEMDRRMKRMETMLEGIHLQIQSCSRQASSQGLTNPVYGVPITFQTDGICE